VVAGTSAGAAAMSGTMIFEGDVARSMRKGNVHMVPGLGLLPNAILDTHFIQRGRITRLLEVIASNPGSIGLGLGEDTGVVIREGEIVEVIGSGVVVVVDGHTVKSSNVASVRLGDPIALEHVVLHTLVEGHRYDIARKQYLHPEPTAS
jgi:cyanophycinase